MLGNTQKKRLDAYQAPKRYVCLTVINDDRKGSSSFRLHLEHG